MGFDIGGLIGGVAGGFMKSAGLDSIFKPLKDGPFGKILSSITDVVSSAQGSGLFSLLMAGTPHGMAIMAGASLLPALFGDNGNKPAPPDLARRTDEAQDRVGRFGDGAEGEQLDRVIELLEQLVGKLSGSEIRPSSDTPPSLGDAIGDIIEGLDLETPTTTAGSSGESSGYGDDPLLSAASKAFDKMNSLEEKLMNLDPDDDNYQIDLQRIQMQMHRIQEAITAITNIMKLQHDTNMNVINKIN